MVGAATVASYTSSSTLAKQIEQAAQADIFIPADAQWIDYLDKKSLIQPAHDLLGNRLVLIVGKDSMLNIDLAGRRPGQGVGRRPPVGRRPAKCPAGIYAKEALTKLGAWDAVQPKLASGPRARRTGAGVTRRGAAGYRL